MSSVTIARTSLLAILLVTFAVGSDKTPPSYQKGTIKGWKKRTDTWGFAGNNGEPIPRNKTIFELRGTDLTGTDLVYLIDYCGAFQAGKFELGQPVDYRVDEMRLYIRRDNGKEYRCKIEGTKIFFHFCSSRQALTEKCVLVLLNLATAQRCVIAGRKR
jgi:hypothetical protein